MSFETVDQASARLRKVIAASTLEWHDLTYAFEEYPISEFPASRVKDALAIVRDVDVWSALLPSSPCSPRQFCVFSFHFPDDLDRRGFVGWLASELRSRLDTGAFVICGHNQQKGGIFDYWGVPSHLRSRVEDVLTELRS